MNIYNSHIEDLETASNSKHFSKRADFLITFLTFKNILCPILDIGKRSPMTECLETYFGKIDNTDGDLDLTTFEIPKKFYATVLYIHTIEHQFNPLTTLLRIKDHIDQFSKIFIAFPRRPYFLQTKKASHYHEISEYGFKNLCDRAGLEIVTKNIHRWKQQFSGITGIRPVVRFFLDKEVIYELRIKLEHNCHAQE